MKLLSAIAVGLQVVAAKVSYDGYKVYHVETRDYKAAKSALSDLDYVSLTCESSHKALEIAVAPDSQAKFEKLDLDAKVTIEDLGVNLAKEGELKPYKSKSESKRGACKGLPDASYFDSYHVFEEHLDFLDDLHAAFVHNSEVFVAGDSLEGRPLSGIHLWGSDGPGKPAIIWHGTVHAREWIVAPTVEYMAYQLIAGYRKKDELLTKVIDQYDFYIMPIVNPDGYVYTTDEDRLWRKNRQVRDVSACVGTDVNRNWPYKWDVSGGSEIDPCDEAYRGEEPGDTPEMAVLTNHTMSIADEAGIKFYVDWHAYSQLLLLPYGYTCNATIKDIDAQMDLAGGVVEAIKSVNGLEFIYGPTCETIYQVSGGSIDYVYDLAGAELAWAFELRPDSPDKGGFVLPPEEIIESAKENWEGMKYLFQNF